MLYNFACFKRRVSNSKAEMFKPIDTVVKCVFDNGLSQIIRTETVSSKFNMLKRENLAGLLKVCEFLV